MSTRPRSGRVRTTYVFIKAHREQFRMQAMCRVLGVAPRLVAGITSAVRPVPLGIEAWQTSRVFLPPDVDGHRLRNVLTGEVVRPIDHNGEFWVLAADVFRTLPVGLLWVDRGSRVES